MNALVDADAIVLDFGAGRGMWLDEDMAPMRRDLRLLKGRVARVVACDTSDAVLDNEAADEQIVVPASGALPFDDGEFDLVIADFVFEHLEDPFAVGRELERVLKPGGWLCGRTPNRRSYVALLDPRLVSNRRHAAVLEQAQPSRQERDVFPTYHRLNTTAAIARVFPPQRFDDHTYFYEPEPGYHFDNAIVFAVMKAVNTLLPGPLKSSLFVFLRKRTA